MPRAIVDPRGSGAQDGRIAGPGGVRHGRLRKTEWFRHAASFSCGLLINNQSDLDSNEISKGKSPFNASFRA